MIRFWAVSMFVFVANFAHAKTYSCFVSLTETKANQEPTSIFFQEFTLNPVLIEIDEYPVAYLPLNNQKLRIALFERKFGFELHLQSTKSSNPFMLAAAYSESNANDLTLAYNLENLENSQKDLSMSCTAK